MAHDEPGSLYLRGDPLDRDPVEPVTANAPVFPPPARHCVGRRLLRHRGVKGRVEHGDVGDVGKGLSRVEDRRERRHVVQRGEGRQRVDLGDDLVVDQRRLDEVVATVDNTVTDRLGGLVRLDPPRGVAFDEVQLEARRAGVDGQYCQVQLAISGSSSPCSRV